MRTGILEIDPERYFHRWSEKCPRRGKNAQKLSLRYHNGQLHLSSQKNSGYGIVCQAYPVNEIVDTWSVVG